MTESAVEVNVAVPAEVEAEVGLVVGEEMKTRDLRSLRH